MNKLDLLEYKNLYCLLALPVVFALLWWSYRRAGQVASLFKSKVAWHWPYSLALFLIVSLLVLSTLRPVAGYQEVSLKVQAHDILLLVDVSQSMAAQDVKPSRLDLAKRKLNDLLKQLTEHPLPLRVGIVAFGGQAYLFCPPTEDLSALKVYMDALSTRLVSSLGSSLENAFTQAAMTLDSIKSRSSTIILVTDGGDPNFSLKRLQELLDPLETPPQIIILGIGTQTGAPIALDGGAFVRDRQGKIVQSKLDDTLLKELAQYNSGSYQQITSQLSDIDLHNLSFNNTDQQAANGERLIRVYRELGPLFALLALGCFIIILVLRPGFLLSCLALGMINLSMVSDAQADAAEQAFQAYHAGDYQKSLEQYEEALRADPLDARLNLGLGNARYRLGQLDQAFADFEQAYQNAINSEERFSARFNQGNVNLTKKDYRAAIKNYEDALSIFPKDQRALTNLDIARKLLEEQEKKEEEKEDKKEDQKEQQQKKQPEEQKTQEQKEQENKEPQGQDQKDQEQQQADQNKESEQNRNQDPQKQDEQGKPEEEKADNQEQHQDQQDQSQQDKAADHGQEQEKQESANPAQDQSEKPAEEKASNEQASQTAEPSPTSGPDGQNADEQNQPNPSASPAGSLSQTKQGSPQSLSEAQAKAWLESLSDSPVLLWQEGSRKPPSDGQTW